MKNGSTYVLGTGLSHDSSACLLKDGKIHVAIEKERITRKKHDGGNDTIAIDYCLRAAGIGMDDLDLVVQNANFSNLDCGNDYFKGRRLFTDDVPVPVVSISHHLAHAYSTIGTCPYKDFNILIIDGCGSSFDDCLDLADGHIPDVQHIRPELAHLFCEKDSYYRYRNGLLETIYKDFSEFGYGLKEYPMHPNTTKHSIGGLYNAVSRYCFGNLDDPGKLMGLGPYGRPGAFKAEIFTLREGRVFVNYDWMRSFRKPALSYERFKADFQYYADIAYGVQKEVERAVLYLVNCRLEMDDTGSLCYAGGVALNAVANAKMLASSRAKHLYMQPAAGDNGLAIGCAFYGWLQVLKQERRLHDQSTCFGVAYEKDHIKKALDHYVVLTNPVAIKEYIDAFFNLLNEYHNADVPAGKPATLQFNIENFGVYQVVIREGMTTSSNTVVNAPTCYVNVAADTFLRSVFMPGYWDTSYENGGIKVSRKDDWNLFQKTFPLNTISDVMTGVLDGQKRTNKVKYVQTHNYLEKAAHLLANGKILGWFQDGSEFGPRALGKRSILADPRHHGVRDFINSQIKFREDFRPFAPSVLAEDAGRYFSSNQDSPYMILVDQVRDEWRETIKSVIHEDFSSRVQTVTPAWNAKYHALLCEFKKATGISLLLNTSFNRKGMPIVETPVDALDFFFSCRLDYLVMEDYIIEK